MSGHTPGPWHLDNGWIRSSTGRTIAAVDYGRGDQTDANICLIAAAPETAAERDRLRAELTAETRRAEDAHGEAQRWALQVENLRAEKAELVAALQYVVLRMEREGIADSNVPNANAVMAARAALAKVTATEGENEDDGVDPTTTELLKPRGNGGVVSADICFNALLLLGDVETHGIDLGSWTQAQLDCAYDWAMRVYLNASDNDDVSVPPRPAYVPRGNT